VFLSRFCVDTTTAERFTCRYRMNYNPALAAVDGPQTLYIEAGSKQPVEAWAIRASWGEEPWGNPEISDPLRKPHNVYDDPRGVRVRRLLSSALTMSPPRLAERCAPHASPSSGARPERHLGASVILFLAWSGLAEPTACRRLHTAGGWRRLPPSKNAPHVYLAQQANRAEENCAVSSPRHLPGSQRGHRLSSTAQSRPISGGRQATPPSSPPHFTPLDGSAWTPPNTAPDRKRHQTAASRQRAPPPVLQRRTSRLAPARRSD
jgi:hypothetical protein